MTENSVFFSEASWREPFQTVVLQPAKNRKSIGTHKRESGVFSLPIVKYGCFCPLLGYLIGGRCGFMPWIESMTENRVPLSWTDHHHVAQHIGISHIHKHLFCWVIAYTSHYITHAPFNKVDFIFAALFLESAHSESKAYPEHPRTLLVKLPWIIKSFNVPMFVYISSM